MTLSVSEQLVAALESQEDAATARLRDLVSIPSVSSQRSAEVERCAEVVKDFAKDSGLHDVELLVIDGSHPYVTGRMHVSDDLPTVLLYAHYDVQPVNPSQWATDPFIPVERDGRLYGRGTADDKSGVIAHLSAIEAWRRIDKEPSANVMVLFDGEEEIGNPTLSRLYETYDDLAKCDVVLIPDALNPVGGNPSIITSTRGVVASTIVLRAMTQTTHSGFWGGPVPDPVLAMIHLLNSLIDERGSVSIKGLGLDHKTDLNLGNATLDIDWLRSALGVIPEADAIGAEGHAIYERLWFDPSVTVIGFDINKVAESSNTIQASVGAKISVRLPPGQDPTRAAALIEKHLSEHAPWGLRLEVEHTSRQQGWFQESSTQVHMAMEHALGEAFGVPALRVGMGATIPILGQIAEYSPGTTCLLLGIEDQYSNAHGSDESLNLQDWHQLALAETLFLQEPGATKTRTFV